MRLYLDNNSQCLPADISDNTRQNSNTHPPTHPYPYPHLRTPPEYHEMHIIKQK